MRPNPLRQKLQAGGTAFGTMAFEFFTPGLFSIAAAAGADFVLLDMEHSGAGADTMRAQLAFARGAGVAPLVRAPGQAGHLVSPLLDAGAMGIMLPLVETADQARALVDWCRYRPEGRRGLGFSVGHDDYAGGDVGAKIAAGNARTLVIALIESERGVAAADEILAVEGIDVGWLGHFDLTDSQGHPGEFDRPEFTRAVEHVVGACARHGKAPGVLAADLHAARRWRRMGFRCLGYGSDVVLLRDALAAGIAALRAEETS